MPNMQELKKQLSEKLIVLKHLAKKEPADVGEFLDQVIYSLKLMAIEDDAMRRFSGQEIKDYIKLLNDNNMIQAVKNIGLNFWDNEDQAEELGKEIEDILTQMKAIVLTRLNQLKDTAQVSHSGMTFISQMSSAKKTPRNLELADLSFEQLQDSLKKELALLAMITKAEKVDSTRFTDKAQTIIDMAKPEGMPELTDETQKSARDLLGLLKQLDITSEARDVYQNCRTRESEALYITTSIKETLNVMKDRQIKILDSKLESLNQPGLRG